MPTSPDLCAARRLNPPAQWRRVSALAILALLAGCGGKSEPAASQTAAKVNRDEVTVHQINFVLQQQRGLRPEQADAAGRQVLERLIDQQLALQKAEDLKLERDPRVLQQLEAARRDIVARAYAERVAEAAARPTREEVEKYYADNPALFAQRRIYSFQELSIEATPEQFEGIRQKLAASKSVSDFAAGLRASGLRFGANQAVRAAEQLPLPSLQGFARMKDGQATVLPAPNGLQVIVLAGSQPQPVALEQARASIEQYLLNERKRQMLDEDRKALRTAARIEYVGKFAAAAASAPAVPASGAAAASTGASMPALAPAGGASAPAALTTQDISKGLGLK